MEQTFIQKAETYKSIYIIKTKIKYKGDTMLEPGSRMREVMKEYEKKGMRKAFPDKYRPFEEGREIFFGTD